MENTHIAYFVIDKEDKARRELETNRLLTDQVKQKNIELQQEMEELGRRRQEINNRLLQNGREIRSYANREQTLTQFLALAEEI